jgi:hypothetical protein
MNRPLLITVVASALCGCAGQYQAPSSGATAKAHFELRDNTYFAMIHTFEKPGCEGPMAIGVIGGQKAATLDTVIPAERPFTVLYTQIGPNTSSAATICKIPATFLPRAGAQYNVEYKYEGSSCHVSIASITTDAQGNRLAERVDQVTKEAAQCSPSKLAF